MSCSGIPGPDYFVNLVLDRADCTMKISQTSTDSQATVIATITDGDGNYVELSDDQAVAVNQRNLSGPGSNGQYTKTVPVSDNYTVTVTEPSRGVENTTIDAPADFEITSPTDGQGVSLSGFTLNWSNN